MILHKRCLWCLWQISCLCWVWSEKLDMLFHFVVRFLIFWPFIVGMSLSFFLSTLFRFLFFFFLSSLGDIYSSFFVFLCKKLVRNIRRKSFQKQLTAACWKPFSLLGQWGRQTILPSGNITSPYITSHYIIISSYHLMQLVVKFQTVSIAHLFITVTANLNEAIFRK